jgi:aconitase B
MLKAAELWAEARKKGKPTADNKALDGDVVLASQAIFTIISYIFPKNWRQFKRNFIRTEMLGYSLCMGNQARVEDKATVFSTSTRNFNNRMGKGALLQVRRGFKRCSLALIVLPSKILTR